MNCHWPMNVDTGIIFLVNSEVKVHIRPITRFWESMILTPILIPSRTAANEYFWSRILASTRVLAAALIPYKLSSARCPVAYLGF